MDSRKFLYVFLQPTPNSNSRGLVHNDFDLHLAYNPSLRLSVYFVSYRATFIDLMLYGRR